MTTAHGHTIVGIDHVQLAMPAGGEDTATEFYEALLGLERVPKPAALAVNGGCWFEAEGVHIHLGVDANFVPASKAHPALLVRDLASLIATLRAAAIEVHDDTPVTGYNRVFTHDPFGNRVELMERTA